MKLIDRSSFSPAANLAWAREHPVATTVLLVGSAAVGAVIGYLRSSEPARADLAFLDRYLAVSTATLKARTHPVHDDVDEHVVQIVWEIDDAGNEAPTWDDGNRSYIGPFCCLEKAVEWEHAYPEDPDVRYLDVIRRADLRGRLRDEDLCSPTANLAIERTTMHWSVQTLEELEAEQQTDRVMAMPLRELLIEIAREAAEGPQ